MRVAYKLFAVLTLFFLIVGGVYAYFLRGEEPVGVVGLFLSAGLSAMISVYLWLTARRLEPGPDDNPAAEIYEAEGDFGFFSPHSWWPIALGASASLVFLGVAIGWWMVFIAAPLLALAVIGWTFEYFRGDNAV